MSRGCPPSTSVCIYCLRELAVQAFDREHVLSEAFGNFQQALVLHPYVCKECNTFFGNELEVRFARGAFEGMLRYQKGVRAPRAGQVHLQFLEFAVPPDNDYAGVRLGLVMDGTIGLCFRVLPQAGFYDDGQGQWTVSVRGNHLFGQ
jgi:hypothetical protein